MDCVLCHNRRQTYYKSIFCNPGPLLIIPKNAQIHKGLEWKVTLALGLVQQPKHFLA